MLRTRLGFKHSFAVRCTSRSVESAVKSSNMLEQKRFCIVSDLDHTMVDHTDHNYPTLLEFNRLWLSKFSHDSYLVFSTGRSLESYSTLRRTAPLLTPDLLICSVGTEIYQRVNGDLELDAEWLQKLDQGWNREKVAAIVSTDFDKLTPQPDTEQRPHKVSYHFQKEGIDEQQYILSLQNRLKKEGLDVKVVYSGGVDVDVLPACASKGLALQFLQKRWEAADCLPKDGIQVNGDSGNDAELFEAPGVFGCIVSNAMEELVHWADAHPSERLFRATERCAAGIMQTMHHFGKVPEDSALPPPAKAFKALVEVYCMAMAWRNAAEASTPAGNGTRDALQAQLLSRLRATPSGTPVASADPLLKSLLTDAQAVYGCCSSEESQGQLLWLDEVTGCEGDAGAWRVEYHVCRAKVGGERESELRYQILLQPDTSAPEGFVLTVAASM